MQNHERSALGAAAALALVTLGAAAQAMPAPRATFHAVCYTAREGMQAQVEQRQALIAQARADGLDGAADALHASMIADLMVERWSESAPNLVTTVGKNDLLDKYLGGSAYTAAWFCGLISSVSYSALAAGDTMASHAGWTEAGGTNAPAYTGNRPALAFAAASAGSKATSSASSFTFTSAGTIKGMFANSVTTKDGTTGILYNAVLFTGGDRTVAISDVVNVSVTYTIT